MSNDPYRGGPPVEAREPRPLAKPVRGPLDPAIRNALVFCALLGVAFGLRVVTDRPTSPVAFGLILIPFIFVFALFQTRWWKRRRERAAKKDAASWIASVDAKEAANTRPRVAVETRVATTTTEEVATLDDNAEDEPRQRRSGAS
jgi:hypothetical protein